MLEVFTHPLTIKGAHEGLKYYCNDCDYKATHRGNLTTDFQFQVLLKVIIFKNHKILLSRVEEMFQESGEP